MAMSVYFPTKHKQGSHPSSALRSALARRCFLSPMAACNFAFASLCRSSSFLPPVPRTGIGFLKPSRFSPLKPRHLATVSCSVSWDDVLRISATGEDAGPVNLEGYFQKVRMCNRGSEMQSHFIPFMIENHVVGYIHNRFMDHLRNFTDVFLFFSSNGHVNHGGSFVTLHPSLKTPEDRTRAVGVVIKCLGGLIPGIRNELYPVKSSFDLPVFFSLERAAAPYFGIKAYGVHMNGYVNRSGRKYLWLARRSDQKPTFPGMLDHLVAGGLPHGISCKENVLKECEEEAGIPRSISTAAIPVGAVSYADIDGYRYKRDVLFCYDLELPDRFVPNNEDGEVDSFRLMPVEHVAKIIQKTESFKPNCCLVIIDFLLRHGYISPRDQGYLQLLQSLRSGDCS